MATAQKMPRTISVTGTGVVDTAPDMALISLAVTHEAKTAGAAMAQVSDDMTALLARLQTLGLDGKDIQTNRLSISPVWDNRRYENGQAPRITGFVASNGLSLRVRDLGALGGILDAVITDGANEMSGLRFTVDDPKPHQDAARARAVADAMNKAQQLANAAGVTLGPLRTMSEHGGGRAPVMMEMAAARSADVPIAAGEVSLSVSVAMVFDILP
ncbi:MAG: SIMPL domain-containing protein [Pseudomonadota bacterium]